MGRLYAKPSPKILRRLKGFRFFYPDTVEEGAIAALSPIFMIHREKSINFSQ
jgi:hypothetical protein